MRERTGVALLGKGTVGSALLTMLDARFKVVAIAGRDQAIINPHGIALEGWGSQTSCASSPRAVLGALEVCPNAILIDCTAADGMERLYIDALRRGVHVVSANKKPLVASLQTRSEIAAAARAGGAQFRYETTVGAGLPVIEPLKDLIRTGDEVRTLEGSFSGTLGFLCSELGRGVPLSRAVTSAKELGFTEPHPREDLCGADVARKALILAREAGLLLELGDVEVEPFVPAHLLLEDDVAVFLRGLGEHDGYFSDRVAQHARDGRVPRYLAQVEIAARTARVGLRWVDASHPASTLRGPESMVAYTSRRYPETPLRVQGPGAGAAVTAAGVLADLLAIERTLSAHSLVNPAMASKVAPSPVESRGCRERRS